MVPVAVLGTADVLPKDGRYSPAPMQVRLGAPLDPHDVTAAELREHVVALRDRTTVTTAERLALAS